MNNVAVIVGMQFGSEGKGKIANFLCQGADVSVRVGGTNAGHTIWHGGTKYAMQTIPVGWTNPDCKLVIGAGALINIHILYREIEAIKNAGMSIEGRLFIDHNAGIITEEHAKREQDCSLHLFNGSTCEGVGAATADRVMRKLGVFKDLAYLSRYSHDTVNLLNKWHKEGKKIVIEGTQGLGLSLFTSRYGGKPFYPKCTSREVTPSAILADCGLSIKNYRTIGVMRTYPIRVGWDQAGYLLGEELTWDQITKECGSPEPLHEKTTVTKRTRRVGRLNLDWMEEMVKNNNIDELAITFLDYINWEDHGKFAYLDLTEKTKNWIKEVEDRLKIPVTILSTGKDTEETILR